MAMSALAAKEGEEVIFATSGEVKSMQYWAYR
jgi:hypothetical protein